MSRADRQMTYAEVSEATDRVAAALVAKGVRPGDRVGWWADTTIDAVPCYFAVAQVGAVFTPVNPAAPVNEVLAVLAKAEPALVVADDAHTGDVSIDELLATRAGTGAPMPTVDERATHVIFFTSGTTGEPKGVELSHRADRLRCMGEVPISPRGPMVVMFPQFHMAGWSFANTCWAAGEEAVFVDGGDTEGLLEAIDRRRAHRFYAIPGGVASAPRAGGRPLRSHVAGDGRHRYVGDAPGAAGCRARAPAVDHHERRVRLDEASAVCRLAFEDIARKPGSVGPPAPGVFVKVVDDELWVRSPVLFSGYFRNPEATADALVDGWYRTGEVVEVDEEGYVSIVGRSKDLIRTGGESVAPVEVDLVLQTHPALADVAVAGVPDPDWGEVITCFAVLRPGHTVDLEELRRHCEGRLARHKHPRRLVVLEAIPRTGPTRQVQRRRLVDIATVPS